mmetsp:Transcript_56642/g.143459  ORF Transcript_56642/g.143459 Transcript_56642/m.143459 type:complete len:311 (+) Transcript_56642:1610-2542(+)
MKGGNVDSCVLGAAGSMSTRDSRLGMAGPDVCLEPLRCVDKLGAQARPVLVALTSNSMLEQPLAFGPEVRDLAQRLLDDVLVHDFLCYVIDGPRDVLKSLVELPPRSVFGRMCGCAVLLGPAIPWRSHGDHQVGERALLPRGKTARQRVKHALQRFVLVEQAGKLGKGVLMDQSHTQTCQLTAQKAITAKRPQLRARAAWPCCDDAKLGRAVGTSPEVVPIDDEAAVWHLEILAVDEDRVGEENEETQKGNVNRQVQPCEHEAHPRCNDEVKAEHPYHDLSEPTAFKGPKAQRDQRNSSHNNDDEARKAA